MPALHMSATSVKVLLNTQLGRYPSAAIDPNGPFKCQTRRPCKPGKPAQFKVGDEFYISERIDITRVEALPVPVPVGDVKGWIDIRYLADGKERGHVPVPVRVKMPKVKVFPGWTIAEPWARLKGTIAEVRRERLWDITAEDCAAEGVTLQGIVDMLAAKAAEPDEYAAYEIDSPCGSHSNKLYCGDCAWAAIAELPNGRDCATPRAVVRWGSSKFHCCSTCGDVLSCNFERSPIDEAKHQDSWPRLGLKSPEKCHLLCLLFGPALWADASDEELRAILRLGFRVIWESLYGDPKDPRHWSKNPEVWAYGFELHEAVVTREE